MKNTDIQIEKFDLLINGKNESPSDGKYFERINPPNGDNGYWRSKIKMRNRKNIKFVLLVSAYLLFFNLHGYADEKADIHQFFKDVRVINQQLTQKKAQALQSLEKTDNDEKKKLILDQIINDTKAARAGLERIATPNECVRYKDISLKIFDNYLEFYQMYLQSFSKQGMALLSDLFSNEKISSEGKDLLNEEKEEYNRIMKKIESNKSESQQ